MRRAFEGDRLTRRLPPVAAALGFALVFLFVPELGFPGGTSVAVYDRRGELLGATVSPSGQWRFPPGGSLPDKFVRALAAYEDRRFFSHPGVDSGALIRALVQDLRAGSVVSGGSTLSMQTARLARPGRPRSLPEKAVELWLALRLELLHGKRGVLALYAENAPFGGNVVGIEAASFRFFGRPPVSLSWAEAATLAVLPNAPSAANPGRNRELLLAKRDRLLETLERRGELKPGDLSLALAEPLPPEPYPLPSLAPRVLDLYATDPGRSSADPSAARVRTTIDAALQERGSEIVARRLERLAGEGVHNAACIVARVDTGEVLAYVCQSADSEDGQRSGSEVDLIRAERSSGSLFKPFLYAAAIGAGELSPRSLVPDLPTRYGSYGPENYDNSYTGAVRAEEALARSLNVPFVRLLRSFGIERFHALLLSTGMTTLGRPSADYGLTLIVGGAETTLWEMAGRYAALARTASGTVPPPGRAGFRLEAAAGSDQVFDLGLSARELADRRYRPNPFSRGAAILTLDALTRVARPDEEAAWQDYASSRRIAWKTGTSFGNRDAWAVGVDGRYVVGVWTGNATGEGMPALKGSAAAAPILFEVFDLLGPGEAAGSESAGAAPASGGGPSATPGAVFKEVEVCADSGWAAGPDCPRTETILMPASAKPLPVCPYCESVPLSADGLWRVRAEEEAPGSVRIEKRFVLPPAMEWYYRRGHLEYQPLPPWRPGTRPSSGDEALAILSPEEGAALYIPIELTGRPGATVFAAADRDPNARLFWHLDGVYLGSTTGDNRLEVRAAPGPHVLTVVDDGGREVTRHFTFLGRDDRH